MIDNPEVLAALIAAVAALVVSMISAFVAFASNTRNKRNSIDIEAFKAKWSKNVEMKSVALERIAKGMSTIQVIKDELYEIEKLASVHPKEARRKFSVSNLNGALEELRTAFRSSIGHVDQADQALIHDAKQVAILCANSLDDMIKDGTKAELWKQSLATTRAELSEIQSALGARRQALLVSIGYEE